MTKQELIGGLAYLGTAFGKEYSQEEVALFYDFMKEINYKTFRVAIKKIIKNYKYAPKVSEMLKECSIDNFNEEILELMRQDGYFKSSEEYEKTLHFIKINVIPKWLRDDLNRYYLRIVGDDPKLITDNKTILLDNIEDNSDVERELNNLLLSITES